MAAPPFSLPPPAYHSPHVSTTVRPAIYAIAIAAIGQHLHRPGGRGGTSYGSDAEQAAGDLVEDA